ncbi:MAG: PKD domain-containing protein [Thermodesulfobacteriota bacterium]
MASLLLWILSVVEAGAVIPLVQITSPADNDSFAHEEFIAFTADASDPDAGTIDDYSWLSSKDGPIGGNSAAFNTNDLSRGVHTITLTVTDSDGETNSDSIVITIRRLPSAVITAPAGGSTFDEGELITFTGTGTDPDDGALAGNDLVWTSSLDGQLGTGSPLAIQTLSAGNHTITLTVTDSDGDEDTASINIKVGNEPPTADITTPASGSSYQSGVNVVFQGTGTDTEDGALSGAALVWTSSLDGQIGTGSPVVSNTLVTGTHVITLTVTDSDGDADTDTIIVTITNQEPTALITAPTSGSDYDEGQQVTFTGTGTDPEDGPLAGNSLVWSSSLDGQLGTGSPLPVQNLSFGTHVITLTVTDSDGDSDAATISVKVGNELPTAVISAPADGSSYNSGDNVVFQGAGSDTEDGALSGASLVWRSSLDNQIGTGATLASDTLSSGSHVITLTATDSDGDTGTDSIVVTIVNRTPTATITSPGNNSSFNENEVITLTGSGTDPEDGNLTGASLVWTSNLDGQIGIGGTLSWNDASEGTHIVTLTASDSEGETGTATVTITAGNAPPSAVIGSPASGARFTEGETISFYGTASDPQDGTLIGKSLVWTSNLGGRIQVIGSGNSVSTSLLAPGSHTVTLTATDDEGTSGTASINVIITAKPVLALSASNLTLNVGGSGTVTVSGGEPPYRAFSRYVHIATADITGATVTVSGVSAGVSTITVTDAEYAAVSILATVTGSQGASGSPPVSLAGDDQVVLEGTTVRLDGSASYDADNAIAAYQWIQTAGSLVTLSDSSSPRLNFIAPMVGSSGATLAFRLTCTDEEGLTDADDIQISVADNGITRYPEGVTTFQSYTNDDIGIMAGGSTKLTGIEAVNPTGISSTANRPADLTYGLISVEAKTSKPGATAVISVYLPEPAPAGFAWYKYTYETGWLNFDRGLISDGEGDGAVFNAERTVVTLYITDNGPYDDDDDLLMVKDPSGLGSPASGSTEEADDDDDSCFIGSLGISPAGRRP